VLSPTTISVYEDVEGGVVAVEETTGIEAEGNNVSTALQTLAEKLEVELYRDGGG